MKNCPKCNNEFDPGKWNRKFCSTTCSNSRTWDEKSNSSRSAKLKGKSTGAISEEWRANLKKAWLDKYNNTPFEKLGTDNRKRRVLEEQDNKCNHCKISTWNDKPLILELEHKDGNNKNNSRENLECICPNCHSQTKTWRGRNNTGRKISDTDLLDAVSKYATVSEALRSLGLPDKGNSHNRAKKLLNK